MHPLVSPHPKRSESPTLPWLVVVVVETLVSGIDDLQTKHVLRKSHVVGDVSIKNFLPMPILLLKRHFRLNYLFKSYVVYAAEH